MNRALRILVNGIALILTLIPFVLLIAGAGSTNQEIANLDFSKASMATWYNNLNPGIISAMWNTLLICIPMVLLQVMSSVLGAFAFAHFKFRGKKTLYFLMISSYLIPGVVTMLPLFFLMTALGLKGSPLGILLPFVLFSPYAIVLLRERFEAVPLDLIDQARLDGLGNWGVLWRISLPITRSFVVLLSVITFVSTWNAYLWPRLIAGAEFPLVTVNIASMQSQYDSHWNLVLAAALLAAVPALSSFVIAKKNLVRNPLEEIEL